MTTIKAYFSAYDKYGQNTFAELARFPYQFHNLLSGRALTSASLLAAVLDTHQNPDGTGAYVSLKAAHAAGLLLNDETILVAPNLKMSSTAMLSNTGPLNMAMFTSARYVESIPTRVYGYAKWLSEPPLKTPLAMEKGLILTHAFTGTSQVLDMVPAAFVAALGDTFSIMVAELAMLMVAANYELFEPLSGYCDASTYRPLCQRNPDAFYFAAHLAAIVATGIARASQHQVAA